MIEDSGIVSKWGATLAVVAIACAIAAPATFLIAISVASTPSVLTGEVIPFVLVATAVVLAHLGGHVRSAGEPGRELCEWAVVVAYVFFILVCIPILLALATGFGGFE